MAIIAGLFDSEADASKALDRLSREDLPGVDTRVINGSARTNASNPNITVPIIPNTSGGLAETGLGTEAPAVGGIPAFGDWLNDMNDVERKFYQDALREGSTLALAKVDEKDAGKVRLIFQTFGARTYKKD